MYEDGTEVGRAIEGLIASEFDGPVALRGFMVIWVADGMDEGEASEYSGFFASPGLSRWEKIGLLQANLQGQIALWETA